MKTPGLDVWLVSVRLVDRQSVLCPWEVCRLPRTVEVFAKERLGPPLLPLGVVELSGTPTLPLEGPPAKACTHIPATSHFRPSASSDPGVLLDRFDASFSLRFSLCLLVTMGS